LSQTDRFTDRVIALAALVQAASLVQQIAETGKSNSSEVSTMLSSLLVKDAPDTTAVYVNYRP
jgi:high frequency lysogenization protein